MMKILILSVNHDHQRVLVGDEVSVPSMIEAREPFQKLLKKLIASRNVDLICEESNPSYLSIAQLEAFNHSPRIPWMNIFMTPQERLEAGIWAALIDRPYDFGPNDPVRIDYRVPEDDVREEFFKAEILKAAKHNGATSVLVLCGDAHTEALKVKFETGEHEIETNRELTPVKLWKECLPA
jgi:hypothetical protein